MYIEKSVNKIQGGISCENVFCDFRKMNLLMIRCRCRSHRWLVKVMAFCLFIPRKRAVSNSVSWVKTENWQRNNFTSVFIIRADTKKDHFNEFVAKEKCCFNRTVLTKLQAANREMLVNTTRILRTPLVFIKLIITKRKNTRKARSE